jgi:Iap family predicted aminopeptidase
VMFLSVMFDTFLWCLGSLPFLRINKNKPEDLIVMDSVGLVCMKYDPVVNPSLKKLKVKMINPDVNIEFVMKSKTKITVYDFITRMNDEANKVFDTLNNDIIVEHITFDDDTLILLTKHYPQQI